jgi:hypothetical protein
MRFGGRLSAKRPIEAYRANDRAIGDFKEVIWQMTGL